MWRGGVRCDRAKALGSNSLKCPVARKKPLRVKNSLVWCVGASSLVRSIAFRPLFLLLRIILVFMASIKCTVDSSTFPRFFHPPLPPLSAHCLNLTFHWPSLWFFFPLIFSFLFYFDEKRGKRRGFWVRLRLSTLK